MTEAASLRVETADRQVRLCLSGPLDAQGIGAIWTRAMAAARAANGASLAADLHAVTRCDTAGVTLLLRAEAAHGGPMALLGADAATTSLVDRLRRLPPAAPPMAASPFTLLGLARAGLRAAADGVAFLGETMVGVLRIPARRRQFRLTELARAADAAGVRAVPLILLLGFLIGLILAFQSAVPLRRFGADLYVANLVAISLLRELGPLLTAVILAGRSGSAFAAELGTMKVNEELAALRTMGLDPMTLLVLPRLAAAVLVMPALTLLLDGAGLIGMGIVLQGFGYPPAAVVGQVVQSVQLSDLWGGLFKALCFGALVAAVGCRAGIGAGIGPRAVGESATGAVVGGIVGVIVLDGIFAVLFNVLGW